MKEKIIMDAIRAILERGNTAEIKQTKDGIIVLEVKRKIIHQVNRTVFTKG